MIASYLADHIVDDVFGTPDRYSALDALVGTYAYAVQIFADFCGYTNIAIGVALLLGFRFPQNFDDPYTASSLRDFWRRWHMTLSRWLRDYLYIPLGGNRKGPRRTYVNLIAVMLLGGLWHGAGWTFVVWGGLHGGGLAAEHWWAERRLKGRAGGSEPHGPPRGWALAWRRLATFHFVCLGWVFFRAESLGDAFAVLGRIATGWTQAPELVGGGVLLAIAVGIGGAVRAGRRHRAADGLLLTALAGRAGSVPRARAHGRRRARPGGRRALHLLPLLMDETARRPMAAGHAVVVVLVALVLGAFLNARGMRKSAEIRPDGWQRDVSVALTRPLAATSGWLLLDRPRAALKDAIGHGDDDRLRSARPSSPRPPPPPLPPIEEAPANRPVFTAAAPAPAVDRRRLAGRHAGRVDHPRRRGHGRGPLGRARRRPRRDRARAARRSSTGTATCAACSSASGRTPSSSRSAATTTTTS